LKKMFGVKIDPDYNAANSPQQSNNVVKINVARAYQKTKSLQ